MASHKTLPSIVLVHGSWHVPEHYERFLKQLREAGFEVFCPLLPTCDKTKRDTADLYMDAEAVREVIRPLVAAAKDVVLVMHSYGGGPGTEAAKEFSREEGAAGSGSTAAGSGAIVHLIYMCSFVLDVGDTLAVSSGPRPVPDRIVRYDDGTFFPGLGAVDKFYGDVEPEYAKHLESLLVPQTFRGIFNPITYAAWKFIPTTYIRCAKDNLLSPAQQDILIKVVQDQGVPIVVKNFESSHSPFASMPEEMVRVVQDALP